MFGFVSEESYEAIVRQNRVLQDTNEELRDTNDKLEAMVLSIEASGSNAQVIQVVPENGIEKFAFDWIAGKAFSIERVNGKTVIGYINAEGKNGEWNFACDEAAHIELVKEFREYVKVKYA